MCKLTAKLQIAAMIAMASMMAIALTVTAKLQVAAMMAMAAMVAIALLQPDMQIYSQITNRSNDGHGSNDGHSTRCSTTLQQLTAMAARLP